MTKKNNAKDNAKNEIILTKAEKFNNVLSQYKTCLLNNDANAEIDKLKLLLKSYKLALVNVTSNINKAIYNLDYTEKASEKVQLFACNNNNSRRDVIIKSLESQACTQADILNNINDFADIKYNRLLKANKKAISGTINDLRNNKAKNFVVNEKDVYILQK